MILGSTSKNVNLLNIFILLYSIIGIFLFNFTLFNIITSIVSFYILNILGNWMMLHRFYSHRSFKFRFKLLEYIFLILAILSGRGSPISWVYIHRNHHANSDTDLDPHSPKYLGFKLFGFGHYKQLENEKMKFFLVKDLMNPLQLNIHKYYMLILITVGMILSIINTELLYFSWILPLLLVHLSQNTFNYFGHMYGYKNMKTTDDSRNNAWLFPVILGEAWHNNHHASPKQHNTNLRWFEIDPLSYVINILKKE